MAKKSKAKKVQKKVQAKKPAKKASPKKTQQLAPPVKAADQLAHAQREIEQLKIANARLAGAMHEQRELFQTKSRKDYEAQMLQAAQIQRLSGQVVPTDAKRNRKVSMKSRSKKEWARKEARA